LAGFFQAVHEHLVRVVVDCLDAALAHTCSEYLPALDYAKMAYDPNATRRGF
jgi:hypothetical protein